MTRVIQDLKWARELDGKPSCIPNSRPRGARALGVRYERALAKAMPMARHGIWYEFEDSRGHGFCQVDLQLGLARGTVVLEVKYTWTAEGHWQVEGLYKPVVEYVTGRPVLVLVVAKKLIPAMHGVVVKGELTDAIIMARTRRVCWHWLGGSRVELGSENLQRVAA